MTFGGAWACGSDTDPAADPAPDAALIDATRPDATADAAAVTPDAVLSADASDADATVVPDPPAHVLINEVDCRDDDRVELVGDASDLDGFTLSTDRAPDRVLALRGPLATRLTLTALPFALHGGETLVLHGPDGAEEDRVVIPVPVAAATHGRLPDGEGPFAPNQPTPDAPNAPLTPPAQALFDTAVIHELSLRVPPDSSQVLRDASHLVVDATFAVPSLGTPETPVGVRLAGRDGRWRRIDQKPWIRLHFDHDDPDARFLGGLQGLILDNTLLDPAVLTTWLAGEVFRAAGVPAPRVGFARLRVNDEDYGLYAVVEPYDAQFLSRHFPSTWQLHAGAGVDVMAGQVFDFEVESGDPHTRRGLEWVAAALDAATPGDLFGSTGESIAWDRVLRMMAVEVWAGSTDGYAPARRALAVHLDDLPVLDLLPAGTDRAFRTPAAAHAGAGRLLAMCLADAACLEAWDATLVQVSESLAAHDFRPAVADLAARLRPHVAADPRTLYSADLFDTDIAAITAYLDRRPSEMATLAACLAAGDDADADGAICDADCAPDDPAVHARAAETCDDGVDQDCSGTADDGPCPRCVEVTRGGPYLVCPGGWTWAHAQSICQDAGMDLVIMNSPGENGWLLRRAHAIARQDWWLGVSDQAEERRFVGVDGLDPPFAAWGDGEPNDYGRGEDCTQLRGDGRWNDLPCDAGLGAICEPPCADPTADVDGDGATACGVDCDDSDPTTHPEAVDVCNDGIDQDCSGLADDAPGCDCMPLEREGRRYLVCPQPRPYEIARTICLDRGADLAVIGDAAENTWLYQAAVRVAPQRYWIGLDDRAVEGAYAWVDGSPRRFVAWSRGEPNDSGRAEDCGHFWEDGPTWNDIACEAQLGAICEVP